jgi:hypothetical protein
MKKSFEIKKNYNVSQQYMIYDEITKWVKNNIDILSYSKRLGHYVNLTQKSAKIKVEIKYGTKNN